MKILHKTIFLPTMAAFLISACTAAMVGGSAARSAGTTFLYMRGAATADYCQPFDPVWNACEKTVADMRGMEAARKKTVGQGVIAAVINGKKVKISVFYKAKNLTSVSVRIGFFGEDQASQFIHDAISENLSSCEEQKLYSSKIKEDE